MKCLTRAPLRSDLTMPPQQIIVPEDLELSQTETQELAHYPSKRSWLEDQCRDCPASPICSWPSLTHEGCKMGSSRNNQGTFKAQFPPKDTEAVLWDDMYSKIWYSLPLILNFRSYTLDTRELCCATLDSEMSYFYWFHGKDNQLRLQTYAQKFVTICNIR